PAAHLHEGDGPPLPHHEVHLASAAVVVAGQDLPTPLLEEGGGEPLGGETALALLLRPRRPMLHAASRATATRRKTSRPVRWTICTPRSPSQRRARASLVWSAGSSSSKGPSRRRMPPSPAALCSAAAKRRAARAASRSSCPSSTKRETPAAPLSAMPPLAPQPTLFHFSSVSAARSCEARLPTAWRRAGRSHPRERQAASRKGTERSGAPSPPSSCRRISAISWRISPALRKATAARAASFFSAA